MARIDSIPNPTARSLSKSNAAGPSRAQEKRLRLLALCPAKLHSLRHGTGLRVHHLLRHLEQSHRITALIAEDFPSPAAVHLPLRRRLRSMMDFSRPYPFQPEFQQACQKAIASGQFDAIVVFGAELLQYVQACRIPVIADLVDEPVLATLRELRAQRGIAFLRSLKNATSLIGYQRRLCRNVSTCLVVSAENARSFARIVPGVEGIVLPNGVDTSFFHTTGLPAREGEIVFSGNMAFPPNIAACRHFAQRIFPGILAEFPLARWTIVGSDPHPSIEALGEHPRITVTGSIPDIRPIIEQAAVVVSPLISGGGIKNKVLEAWAMRKGIVATPLGCAGVEAHDKVNLLIAKDARSFIEKTVGLLRNPPAAEALGEAGYRTVIAKYSWQDKGMKLEHVLQLAVARTRGLA